MNTHPAEASWQLMHEGGQNIARLRCSSCPAHHDIKMVSHLPTEVIMKKFQKHGWTVHVSRPDKCQCPDCFLSRRRSVNKLREAPKMVEVFPAPHTNSVAIPIGTSKQEPVLAAGLTPLTQANRTKIREMLDTHFDDAAGRYLDNLTDQKVGEKIGVPWKHVEEIRRLAYGELKEDPELTAIRAQLNAADEKHRELGDLLLSIDARARAIEKRLGLRP